MKMKKLSLFLGLAASLGVVACDSDTTNTTTKKVTMTLPSTTDLVPGSEVTITVAVENFTLTEIKEGLANVEGQGHYHIYLDDKTGTEYLTAGHLPEAKVKLPEALTDGAHKLTIQLFNNDHTPVDPVISQVVDFTVKATSTTAPKITATADKTTVEAGGKVVVTVAVENFTLTEIKEGATNETGKGHYHVYWDTKTGTEYLNAGYTNTVELTIPSDATDGAHTLTVQLFNNDHTALTPEVKSVINLTVGKVTTAPTVSITGSKTVDLERDEKVTLTVTTTNFTLAKDSIGKAAEAGKGHYHVYWNDKTGVDYLTAGADNTVEVTVPSDATGGANKFRIELYNNDHSPLSPPVDYTLNVTVKAQVN